MEVIAAFGAWALGNSTLTDQIPSIFPHYLTSPSPTVNITLELGSQLSPNARINFPGSQEFVLTTDRWQSFQELEPNITIVVEVATESDVQATIKYAKKYDIPFLAMTGGHGAIRSLSQVKHGIEIWTRKMDTISISEDGQTAVIGGGVLSKEITDVLWDAGKQTVTGLCECTSLMGPLLGGGHGILQGRYGLVADNLLSARVVLADGSLVVTSESESENPDLFWALRGAGHNFGIVTEVRMQIYDVPVNDIWAYETFIYSREKVKEVFARINEMSEKSREGLYGAEVTSWAYFLNLPDVDAENAILLVGLYQEQQQEKTLPSSLTSPFHALSPIISISRTAQYPDLAALTNNGNENIGCAHGSNVLRFPISLLTYNTTCQARIYEEFNNLIISTPEFNGSLFLFEGYALDAVQKVADEKTAFPHRGDVFLVSPIIIYPPSRPDLDSKALAFGKGARQILKESNAEGDELHAYVNYAHGDETVREMYGYETWRGKKLRELKKRYDPEGRFNYYAPISVEEDNWDL